MYNPNQMNQMSGQGMRPGHQPMQRPGMPMQPTQHMQQMYGGQPMHQQRAMNMAHGQPQPMGGPMPMGGHQQPYQMQMSMQQPMGMHPQSQHQMMGQEPMQMPGGPQGMGHAGSMQAPGMGPQGMPAPGMQSGHQGGVPAPGQQSMSMPAGPQGMQAPMQTGSSAMEHSFSPQDVKMIPTPQSQQQMLTPQSMQQPMSAQPMSQQPMSQQPVSQQPMSQSSMQQPLSQQPLSQQPLSQQPMSQQPMSQQPFSQQPMSQQPLSQQPPSNAPATPATPQQALSAATHQTPMSVPPAGSAQPDSTQQPPQSTSQISQQFPLAHTDPIAAAKNMILKDLRLSITELNDSVAELGKKFASQQEALDKKQNIAPPSNANPLSVNPQSVNPLSVNPPGSVKSIDEPKSHDVNAENSGTHPSEQYKTAMNNFLSVCHNIEANLMLVLETQRQYKKFELMSEIKTPGDIKEFPPHLQNFVESMNEDKGHIDDTIKYVSNLVEKVRTSEKKASSTQSMSRNRQISGSNIPSFSMQHYSDVKNEYMDVDDQHRDLLNY